MRRVAALILIVNVFFVSSSRAQLLSTSVNFPQETSTVTITVDCTKGNQGLMNYANTNDVYVHVGVITSNSSGSGDWKYVKFAWGTTDAAARATYLSPNKYQYTITNIRSFFGVPAGESILRIAILFRNGTGSQVQRNTNGNDMFIRVYDNNPASKFLLPPYEPQFIPVPEPVIKTVGSNIDVNYISNQAGTLTIYFNGTQVNTASAATSITSSPVITNAGSQQIVGRFTNGVVTLSDTVNFFVAPPVDVQPLPAGVRDGINYLPNETSVVLVLYAPGKNKVSVVGDFNNWTQGINYTAKKTPDGKYFWLQIDGLTPGTEYGYQYIIDDNLKVADYYAEKILDPNNDPGISAATYPNLKPYPTGKTTGIVSVLQTKAPQYVWKNSSFVRPDKKNLLIYEMLVRDFVAAHDYKTIRDTLSYLKRLGINTLELMPVNEFDGNSSWGYNPAFFFAADKYYGPANSLKELIDSCHSNGIAVVLDIVLNHSYGNSPMVQMYFDGANNRPAANNPWFNPVAPHSAITFGYDFNHESEATKYFVDRVLEYWQKEFRIDGFRFDFTKGLTQKVTSSDAAMSAYDASRVNILKRINDSLQSHSPGSYMIIEHLADVTEERDLVLAGMLPWGNMTHSFNEATMGWVGSSNFDWALHERRGFAEPLLISYMESHDEERLMYKNLKYGNASSNYSVKDTLVGLRRNEMAAAFYFAIPGPKMVWQFGEVGYDISRCHLSTNGEGGDCDKKLDPKPIRWEYQNYAPRKRLFEVYSALMKLRKNHPNPFTSGSLSYSLGGAFKTLQVSHPDMNIAVIGNFDVNPVTASVTLQNAGTWYNYLTGEPFTASGGSQSFTLAPGEYKFLVNKNVVNAVVTGIGDIINNNNQFGFSVYPNPVSVSSQISFSLPSLSAVSLTITDLQGRTVVERKLGVKPAGVHRFSVGDAFRASGSLSRGTYLITLSAGSSRSSQKILY